LGLFNFTRTDLYKATDATTGFRPRTLSLTDWQAIAKRVHGLNAVALDQFVGSRVLEWFHHVWISAGPTPLFCLGRPCTFGQYIFLPDWSYIMQPGLIAHEYIHVLQYEGRGGQWLKDYLAAGSTCKCTDAGNAEESVGYLWQYWMKFLGAYEVPPWRIWKRYGTAPTIF
jgi:hypothetical protein